MSQIISGNSYCQLDSLGFKAIADRILFGEIKNVRIAVKF